MSNCFRINYKAILILTFISGLPVLIYEIVWARMLTNYLGSSVYAVTIITATFMLGLALGSYFLGQYADRRKRYLRLYAFIEIFIGLSALAVPVAVVFIKIMKFDINPSSYPDYGLFITQRALVAFFVLLIPTFFMGGTFPVLSKVISSTPKLPGTILGYLYSFNTIGAIIGCLLATFVLIEYLGLKNSLLIAAMVNISIGLICLVLDYKYRPESEASYYKQEESKPALFSPGRLFKALSFRQKLLLLAFGLSGFAALAYEIIWIRMLTFWLKNTTFSFGLILSIFLSCIALGSLVSAYLIDKFPEKKLVNLLAVLELFIGLAALLAIYLYSFGVESFMTELKYISHSYRSVSILSQMLVTLLTFFLIAFPFGMIFPLNLKLVLGKPNISWHVGLGYMVNTLGSMLGALITGLLLIPNLGVQKSLYLVSFINILIFCLIFVFNNGSKIITNKLTFILTIGLSLFIIQTIIPIDYLKNTMASKIREKIVYFKEGRDSTVILAKSKNKFNNNVYSLWINGLFTASNEPYMEYRGHIPVLLSSNPKDALVIGFGSGTTLGIVAKLYGLKTDCVEISKSVIEAGRISSEINYDVLNSHNVNIYIMDARNFVELTKKKYDIIIVDTSQPYLANSNSLFSREFYANCYRILKDDGIMLQWMPHSIMTKTNYKILLKTFNSVFDNSYLFLYDNLIGTKKPLTLNLAAIDKKISSDMTIKQKLNSLAIKSGNDVKNLFITDKNNLDSLTSGMPVITDDNPIIEFTIFRDEIFRNYNSSNVYSLKEIRGMKTELSIN